MIRFLLFKSCLLLSLFSFSNTIIVKNNNELIAANKKAVPGDVIILQNGEWNTITIKLDCNGTKEAPIVFKAETAGKVIITGNSSLKLGGSYIVVDGLYFANGYAGDNAVIDFRINSKQLANNCRVTNCVINDFNNPKRMEENYWVSFSGKNNRLDHCSFKDKKNMGVLLAVILDDERSRENFHSIDHNYFGKRPPLASNSGEIIRVGVSQHCQFNSNTQIVDNFFEHCDGETEIVSIKSCSNVVRGNVFKESQGGVVLRHGDNNTVENNIFLGNDKEGTGGVRIINKGQWVVNNFFYKCRGVDFRSPLSIMNGIPNSPANRYVQVTDAVIANNTFYNCSTASFCEGSDAERTLAPNNVLLINNIFFNDRDTSIYKIFDSITGFTFSGNEVNKTLKQQLLKGFDKVLFTIQKNNSLSLPITLTKGAVAFPDSLNNAAQKRLGHSLSTKPGFASMALIKAAETNANTATGAKWFSQSSIEKTAKTLVVNCATATEVYTQLEKKEPVTIRLTAKEYLLNKPFIISKNVEFTSDKKTPILFTTDKILSVFVIAGNGNLTLNNLIISGENVQATNLISSDSTGSSNHYNFSLLNSTILNFNKEKGCANLFFAYKYMVADSIIIRNNSFEKNNTNGIMMIDERENKGYYNAEKIVITKNKFDSQSGTLLSIYRGGNDESTMGPNLSFIENKVKDCNTSDNSSLISFTGVQVTLISTNKFSGCNTANTLVSYKDIVRARHRFENNAVFNSGKLEKNQFVTEKNNTLK